MVAGNLQESQPSAGFLAPVHQKPVTAMPVFSSDVQQYMICKSGGAHGFATMRHAHTLTHSHTHTHTHHMYINTSPYSVETHIASKHTQQAGIVIDTRKLMVLLLLFSCRLTVTRPPQGGSKAVVVHSVASSVGLVCNDVLQNLPGCGTI